MTEILDGEIDKTEEWKAHKEARTKAALERPPHPDYPNLRPFTKGTTGNPYTRKKAPYRPFRDAMRDILTLEIVGKDPILHIDRVMTIQERLILQWIYEGVNGNVYALKTLKEAADEMTAMLQAEQSGAASETIEMRRKNFRRKIEMLQDLKIDPFKKRKQTKL